MERIETEILVNTLTEKVEGHLQLAVDVFQNTPEEILRKPSANGGWSIAQCLQHLNLYGEFYLPELRKGLARNASLLPNPWFRSSWIGYHFTRMMDPVTGKRKYKAMKGYQPPREINGTATVAEFIAQQKTLLQLLNLARATDLNKVRIPVSISRFIRLKAGDVFQFVIAHNERHLLQAKRNLQGAATS